MEAAPVFFKQLERLKQISNVLVELKLAGHFQYLEFRESFDTNTTINELDHKLEQLKIIHEVCPVIVISSSLGVEIRNRNIEEKVSISQLLFKSSITPTSSFNRNEGSINCYFTSENSWCQLSYIHFSLNFLVPDKLGTVTFFSSTEDFYPWTISRPSY